MEVINMPGLAEELQGVGVGLLDSAKYEVIISVLGKVWEENAMGEDTDKFTRDNAQRLMVRLYDHYNDNESENDESDPSELREMLKAYAYINLEGM